MISRNNSLDFIRAFAILLILLSHLPGFIHSNQILVILEPYFANLGLGLFIFFSGYVIFLNNRSTRSTQDILAFYKKRVVRIVPLYLIALLIFFVVFGLISPVFGYNSGMDFGVKNLIIHILCLQIVLSPAYADPILTLYFIGLIMVFYFLYPLLLKYSHSMQEFFLISLIPFILCIVLRHFFNVIDDYFFRYYFVFIFGIMFCYLTTSDRKKSLKILIISPIILVLSLLAFSYSGISSGISAHLITYILIISFCLVQYEISAMFIDAFSPQTQHLFCDIAVSSYAIYLFHRPILTIFSGISEVMGTPALIQDLILIFIAIPAVFLISFYIQRIEQKIL